MLPASTRARVRLAMVVCAVLAVGWLVWSSRAALYPFILGVILVFVLAPIVDRVVKILPFRRSHPDLALGLSVVWVYAVFILILVVVGIQLAPRIGAQGSQLADNVPSLIQTARQTFETSQDWYRERVPENIQRQIDVRTQDLGNRASDFGVSLIERTIAVITGGVANLIAYIVVPFWIFFVLKDREKGAQWFYGMFPPAIRDDVRVVLHQANRVLGSYIRAQLLLSTVSGVVAGVGLWLMGIKFSLILGVIAGIANMIPVLGPMIGGVPAIIVTAATRPGWTVLWVFLFLFVSQNMKDYILVPRIQGNAVNIHPAIILVLLVIAGHLAGFWGLLLAVPVAAVIRDIYVYIYRRLEDIPPDEAVKTSEPAHLRDEVSMPPPAVPRPRSRAR